MKIYNIIICLVVMLAGIFDVECGKYLKLENDSGISIKKEDLPCEFGDDAYETVVDFIQKTRGLDYEWVVYFDYVTGDILRCASGESNNVVIQFDDGEFDGCHVASIHNHPENVYSPPSENNFGILARGFEDYELVASINELWILMAKGVYPNIYIDLKISIPFLLDACQDYCDGLYSDDEKADEMCDMVFGEVYKR